jgi:peptidylprolyl isomerase
VTIAKYMRTLTVVLLIALLAGTTMTLSACGGGSSRQTAQIGDNVSVLYNGTLDNGSVFDASSLHGNVPLQFVIGAHTVLTDFEDAVVNMSVNQSKTIHISAEDAYGPTEVTYNITSTDTPPILGQQYTVELDNGKYINAVATSVTNTSVTFQNTHALAGQNLTFNITLVKIGSSK